MTNCFELWEFFFCFFRRLIYLHRDAISLWRYFSNKGRIIFRNDLSKWIQNSRNNDQKNERAFLRTRRSFNDYCRSVSFNNNYFCSGVADNWDFSRSLGLIYRRVKQFLKAKTKRKRIHEK